MNYIHLYSKKKQISKLINMDHCTAMGVDDDMPNNIYVITKDNKYIICTCQNDENAYDICLEIIKQYATNSIHSNITMIDVDQIIHKLKSDKREDIS